MTTVSRFSAAAPLTAARHRINLAIEACWLAAIVTTALAFHGRTFFFHFTQPKQNVLHLFALAIASLWLVDLALSDRTGGVAGEKRPGWRIWEWGGRDPARWMLVLAGALAMAQVLSTALSPFPVVSLFGRDLNDPGYELYSGLSYMAVFAAIALRVRSHAQVQRLLLVVAASGSVVAAYGASQHFGWDPIGYGAGAGRVPSSMGNPIFMASFLVMSVFAVFAVYLLGERRLRSWPTLLAAPSVGVHLAAIWFSGSRGPLVAVVVAVVVMSVSALLLLDWRQLVRGAMVGLLGLFVGLLLILLPAPESATARSGRAIIGSILGQAAAATGSEISLSNDNLATDNVGRRVQIWTGGLELLRTRESTEGGGAIVKALRHLFGYGPEMYYYAYPLTAEPRAGFILVSHAHNFPLHIWLEFGLLGIVSLVGLSVAAVLVLLQIAWRLRRGRYGDSTAWFAVMAVGLLAILAGRVTEQMVGVARVADLTAFWAILGLVVATKRITNMDAGETPSPVSGGRAAPTRQRRQDEYRPLWVGGAIGVGVLAVALWGAIDGSALYASRLAARANHEFNAGDGQAGYELMKRAAQIDRYSEPYGLIEAQIERNAAGAEEDRQRKLETLLLAYRTLAEYEQAVPWALNNDIRLTATIAAIADLGVTEATGELWDRTVDLDLRMRPYPKVMAFVANSYVALGEFTLGIEVADYAIETAGSVGIEVSQAWWAKGEALGRIGETEEAIEALETATEVEPETQFAASAHRTLAGFFEEQGDLEKAEQHRKRADEIELALISGA